MLMVLFFAWRRAHGRQLEHCGDTRQPALPQSINRLVLAVTLISAGNALAREALGPSPC